MKALTHAAPAARIGKLCRCNLCGTEQICSRNFDFYHRPEDGPLGPLYCFSCLMAVANRGQLRV